MADYLDVRPDPEDYAEATAWFNECKKRRKLDRERIAELEATRNELMATVEQVVGRLDKANGELAKYKWMTRQGLIAEYGAQQLDAEYEAQLMGLLETEYVARAEEGGEGEHLTGCLCPTCKRKTGGEL